MTALAFFLSRAMIAFLHGMWENAADELDFHANNSYDE
jgi:hypothetical protein